MAGFRNVTVPRPSIPGTYTGTEGAVKHAPPRKLPPPLPGPNPRQVVARDVRSLTPPAQPQERLEDLEQTPAQSPRAIDALGHELLRRELSTEMDKKLSSFRKQQDSGWKQRGLVYAAIVTAIGALGAATVNWTGEGERAKTVAKAEKSTSDQLVAVNRQLGDIYSMLGRLGKRLDEEHEWMKERLAARPMQKNPDLVTAVRQNAQPTTQPGAGPPERPASRYGF